MTWFRHHEPSAEALYEEYHFDRNGGRLTHTFAGREIGFYAGYVVSVNARDLVQLGVNERFSWLPVPLAPTYALIDDGVRSHHRLRWLAKLARRRAHPYSQLIRYLSRPRHRGLESRILTLGRLANGRSDWAIIWAELQYEMRRFHAEDRLNGEMLGRALELSWFQPSRTLPVVDGAGKDRNRLINPRRFWACELLYTTLRARFDATWAASKERS